MLRNAFFASVNDTCELLLKQRRVIWTASEMEEAETIKSGDLQQIKNLHCAKTGLNPFHMPPTL